jgi:hypothetical protein
MKGLVYADAVAATATTAQMTKYRIVLSPVKQKWVLIMDAGVNLKTRTSTENE